MTAYVRSLGFHEALAVFFAFDAEEARRSTRSWGIDYGPAGPYLSAAWATDEVNSMMSYIDLNRDYSQFDRDNANRFQAAGYYKIANRIPKDILASPQAGLASGDLATADTELTLARIAMAAHDYNGTFDHARLAYNAVRAGAAKAGVAVGVREPSAWALLAPQKVVSASTSRPTPTSTVTTGGAQLRRACARER